MMFEVELINIGRDDVCQKYNQEARDINEIAQLTYWKIKRFLLSQNVTLEPDNNDEELWNVYAGFRNVGKVRIKQIGEKIKWKKKKRYIGIFG